MLNTQIYCLHYIMKFQDVTFAELVFYYYYEILEFSVHPERMAYLHIAFTACRQFIHY